MCEVWTQTKILQLIKAYHSKECLWKTSSKEYSDRTAKCDAWKEVAEAVECDIHQAERKMKIVKTQFMSYYKQSMKNGSGHRPKWFAYNALLFLIETRDSSSSQQESSNEFESPQHHHRQDSSLCSPINEMLIPKCELLTPKCELVTDDEENEAEESDRAESFAAETFYDNDDDHDDTKEWNNIETDPSKPFKKPENSIRKRKTISNDDDHVEETYNFMKSVQSNLKRDEFTVFGEHVAFRLRNITDSRARVIAQYNINNILFEAEIGKLPTS